MKKRQGLFFGIAVLLIAALFTLAGCGGGTTGPAPGKITYSGRSGSDTYTLTITENTNRAAYTPEGGDSYVLTTAGKTSSGTVVSWDGNTLTLTSGNADFTAAISGSGIVSIDGSVNWTMPGGSKIVEVVSLTFDTNDDEDEDEGEAEYWRQWVTVQKAQGNIEGWPSAGLQSTYSVNFNNEGEIKLYQHYEVREELVFLKVGSLSNFDDLMSQINTAVWEQIANTSDEGFRYVVYQSRGAGHSGLITATFMASPYSLGVIQIEVKKIDDGE